MQIFIPGHPKPQPRPRATAFGGHARVYHKKFAWREQVGNVLADAHLKPMGGPYDVTLEFLIPRPKGHYRTGKYSDQLKPSAPRLPLTKSTGDVDNLAKAVLDEMNGRLITDDSEIVALTVRKVYADPGAEGVRIHVLAWVPEKPCPF